MPERPSAVTLGEPSPTPALGWRRRRLRDAAARRRAAARPTVLGRRPRRSWCSTRDEPVSASARERVRGAVARRARARAGRLHPRPQGVSPPRAARSTARVLIPRPETELLVEVGLELPPGASVLDVGTGSGAVALALARRAAGPRGDAAIDVSADALAVARANAARLGLDVEFVHRRPARRRSSLSTPCWRTCPTSGRTPSCRPRSPRYEPARRAVRAAPTGSTLVRRLVARHGPADRVPLVALELGAEQADAVAELLRGAGLRLGASAGATWPGIERVVVGRR